jgi:ATP-binding cassette, subfamily C, bacterial PrsD
VNLLMLAGPLYMLQVYDRVLSSRSVPTLIALSIFLVGAAAAYLRKTKTS